MSYWTTVRHNLDGFPENSAEWKKANAKKYDSVYITFVKWQNYGHGDISGFQGLRAEGRGMGGKKKAGVAKWGMRATQGIPGDGKVHFWLCQCQCIGCDLLL